MLSTKAHFLLGKVLSRSFAAGRSQRVVNAGSSKPTSSVRSIVTDYDFTQTYSKKDQYTVLSTLERAKEIYRSNGVGAYALAVRLQRPLHLEELNAALDYIQARHTKLGYTAATMLSTSAGMYSKVETHLPVELEERLEDAEDPTQETQLTQAVEDIISKPLDTHLMKVKVLYAPEASDIVFGFRNGVTDLASASMVVNEVLERYAALVDFPNGVKPVTEVAPRVHELSDVFPSAHQIGFFNWKAIRSSTRQMRRMMPLVANQSPMRFDVKPAERVGYFVGELGTDLTKNLKSIIASKKVDDVSAVAAANLVVARKNLFQVAADQNSTVDATFTVDLRSAAFFPPLPVNSLYPADIPVYTVADASTVDFPKPVWDVAAQLDQFYKNMLGDSSGLFDIYHFAIAAASVRRKSITSMPHVAFNFVDARSVKLTIDTVANLRISDVRVASTPIPGCVDILLSEFEDRLSLTYNYPRDQITSSEIEKLFDEAADLLLAAEKPQEVNAAQYSSETTTTTTSEASKAPESL